MAVMAGVGTFLTAAYLIRYFQRAFLGDRLAPAAKTMADLRPREILIAVTLGGFIFWVGLYTTPFLQTMNGSLRAIEQRVERGSFGGTGAADPLELIRYEVRP
jgi:NADH-quinone oxidoreductase subunit M